LTIVGDGPKADYLRHVAEEVGAAGMVSFVKAMPNDRLCAFLAECDIYATHSEYHEVSKAILEAMLTGLPVVINRRRGAPVPELIGDHVMMVDNLPEAYRNAMCSLIEDNALRENIGRRGLAYARAHWEPNAMERRVVDIYRSISSLPSGN
jgi:glycosyltransferase involved in cell wall biosynthesis